MNALFSQHIGFLTDENDYVHRFIEKSGLSVSLITLESDLPSPSCSQFPLQFMHEGIAFDSIVIYAHLGLGNRQKFGGITWIQRLRLLGFVTPVILLMWESPTKVQIQSLSNSSFVSAYFRDSCALVRLPCGADEVYDALKCLKPVSHRDWQFGREWVARGGLKHELSHVARHDTLEGGKAALAIIARKSEYSSYSERLVQLDRLSSLGDLRVAIDCLRRSL